MYSTWDDVINRWIGKQKADLYLELGPPNLHPKEAEDGTIEMVWDMTIDRMPGQADEYNTLPLYGGGDCRLFFFADKAGLVTNGRRMGCGQSAETTVLSDSSAVTDTDTYLRHSR